MRDLKREDVITELEGAMVVGVDDKGNYQFQLTAAPDPSFERGAAWAIILSDAIDHIAAMYADHTDRSEKSWRKTIIKHFKLEEQLKAKDPNRADLSGLTIRNNVN